MDKVLHILDGDDDGDDDGGMMSMTAGMQVTLLHGHQRVSLGSQCSSAVGSLDLTQIIKLVGQVPFPLRHPFCPGQDLKASGFLGKKIREERNLQ